MFPYQRSKAFNPVTASKLCVYVCLVSVVFVLGVLAALPCAPAVSHSRQLHRAESGSLTCLIAFDSSLSSPVDQWSSALFIRNINVLHIPTGSATNPQSSVREGRFILLHTEDNSRRLCNTLFHMVKEENFFVYLWLTTELYLLARMSTMLLTHHIPVSDCWQNNKWFYLITAVTALQNQYLSSIHSWNTVIVEHYSARV